MSHFTPLWVRHATRTTHDMNRTDTPSPIRSAPQSRIRFRSTRPSDGAALWQFVQSTGTLEPNSVYFYVLFAADFGDTCLVAEQDGRIVGAVIGFHPPREADTAFVWQVGVLPEQRGQGLGLQLLQQWLSLPANARCCWVTATVADDNKASRALFQRLAREHDTDCQVTPHFTADLFPSGHPAEPMLRVGPIARHTPARGVQSQLENPIPV